MGILVLCQRVDTFPARHALRWTLYALPDGFPTIHQLSWWPGYAMMNEDLGRHQGPHLLAFSFLPALGIESRALCKLDKLVQSHIHSFLWSLRWSVTKLPRLTLNSLSQMIGTTMPVAHQSSAHISCANCLTVLYETLNGNSSTWSVRLSLR